MVYAQAKPERTVEASQDVLDRMPLERFLSRSNVGLAIDYGVGRLGYLTSFLASVLSLALMKPAISGTAAMSFSHCSRYRVTGKRPMP